MKKTAFIGHREFFCEDIKDRLQKVIEEQIENSCKTFTMGTHGKFDHLALAICRDLRNDGADIKIQVVITSLHKIEKKYPWGYPPYYDVETIMYDIEEAHYKQQITLSNYQMLDTCDTLICYVNEKKNPSGAKTAMRYAKRKGMQIINLYREEDNPYYGMTKDELCEYGKKLHNKIRNIEVPQKPL